jgi:hypothetical protein
MNERGRELNMSCCKLNEENVVWFILGIWKLRVLRKGTERGRCPLYGEEENESHIFLKCKRDEK